MCLKYLCCCLPTTIQKKKDSMDGLNFLENSRVMFDKVVAASPALVRHFSKTGLIKGLKSHGCGDVTEALMYTVVREVVPAKYLEATLKILDANRTVFPPDEKSKEEAGVEQAPEQSLKWRSKFGHGHNEGFDWCVFSTAQL